MVPPSLTMLLKSRWALYLFGTIMIFVLVGYVSLFRSSPGELSRVHGKVAGSSFVTDCKKCHEDKNVSVGCLKCHSEIKSQVDRKSGYHFTLLKDASLTCLPCHSEHNGPDYQLINKVSWQDKDISTFDHSHCVFSLKGKHKGLECQACHVEKLKTKMTLPGFETSPREKSFMGLTQKCDDCHEDVHAGGATKKCERCHSQSSFRPAVRFDHNRFFTLVGAHKQAKCNACHTPPTKAQNPELPNYPFLNSKGTRCSDCHENPHTVNWKTGCESCHKATDIKWSLANNRTSREKHALTGFRLVAPHNKVKCEVCHNPKWSFEKKYTISKNPTDLRSEKSCEKCHADSHRGQFSKGHPKCVSCHNISGFVPSKITQKTHTTYTLEGGHARATCNKCHVFNSQIQTKRYVGTPKTCSSCHKDIHMGQFRSNGITECEKCHRSTISWKSLVFDHNAQSKFKLDQAHTKVTCESCHPRVNLRKGGTVIQYKPIKSACHDCHESER